MTSAYRREDADLLDAAQAEVDRLRAQVEQACAERDAALIEARAAHTDRRAVAVGALREAADAAGKHWRESIDEGMDHAVPRHWSATRGWLRRRADAIEAGNEPDWPDAARMPSIDPEGED